MKKEELTTKDVYKVSIPVILSALATAYWSLETFKFLTFFNTIVLLSIVGYHVLNEVAGKN